MAALEDLRAANAELAARVAAYEASEKEEKRRIEKAMDRAEQKIRAAASKVERMAKKHEDEGRELEEKRAEVARLYKDCRESRESSDKYKFEWDRSTPGQEKSAKFPTSKAPLSAVFHSFRLIFGRAIISRNGLEAWMLFPERARAEHSR